MNLDKVLSNIRRAACVALVAALWLGAGCRNRNTDNVVVVRILLPPFLKAPSALSEAIMDLGHSPMEMDTGRKIIPAWIPAIDDDQFRSYLKGSQLYAAQIVVVPTKDDIPAPLRGENTYATLPCTAVSSAACVSVVTPWARDEERRAASLLIRRLGRAE